MLKGIDVSNNNGSVNFDSVKAAGIDVVYIKATEGTTYIDKNLDINYKNAHALGLKTGFYHFLVGSSSPESQAQNFYNCIENKQSDLIPMLDIETNFSGIKDYQERFIAKFKELSGMEIGIYTYSGFMGNISSKLAGLKLWEANYNNTPFSGLSNNSFKRVGHQYTEKGTAGSFKGDMNQFTDDVLIVTGDWIKDQTGWWYRHKDGTCTKEDWEKIDGDWYYFDKDGYMYSARWKKSEKSGKWYYLKENGKMAHDCTISYSFDKDGAWIK